MHIIGITGTNASGKGTIVEYLCREKGYTHYSVRNFLQEELTNRNLPLDRDQMRNLANELRATYGPAYIVNQLYLQARAQGTNAIIESIRAIGEFEQLQKYKDFLLLSVDADQKLRYERAVQRNSESDQVSFEVFQTQEALEMTNTDPNKQNISECMKRADIIVRNDGTFEELYAKLDEIFSA